MSDAPEMLIGVGGHRPIVMRMFDAQWVSNRIRVVIGAQSESGRFYLARMDTLRGEILAEGADYPPSFTMSKDQAQEVMDDLWRCGIRPTEGQGSAGAFAAQGRHLDDMRTLVFEKRRAD